MQKQKKPSSKDIRKNLNFIYGHLTNIVGEISIIMAEIDEMKRNLDIANHDDLTEVYDNLSDSCKNTLRDIE